MKYSLVPALAATTVLFSSTNALDLDTTNEDSIRNTAATVAEGLMAYYTNGQPTTPPNDIGTFAHPVYWWNAGAIWGGMVDYAVYTGDESHTQAVSSALAANIGEKADLILESKRGQQGNDDQAFWALSIMSAAEANFPVPEGKPSWREVAVNAFENMITRWDDQNCGGGLFWQIYDNNFHGLKYKNSVANGGLFQLAARLGIMTGEQKYVDWANRVWDWVEGVGFIGEDYAVRDGAGIDEQCKKIDQNTWTYNAALFTYGAAAMYDHTKDDKWLTRTNGLVKSAGRFFNAHENAPNVMTEIVCEHVKCNMDQQSFKAYLSRWLGKTSVLVPETAETIKPWLEASAKAAAASCSGPNNACGQRWYTGGYNVPDHVEPAPLGYGLNQQLCAMEVIQSLLVSREKMYGQPDQDSPPPEETPTVPEVPASSQAPEVPASSEIPSAPEPSADVPVPPPSETPAPSEAPPAPEPTSESPAPSQEEDVAESTAILPVETIAPTVPCSAVTVTETVIGTSTAIAPEISIPVETPPVSQVEPSSIATITYTPSSLVSIQPTPPSSVGVGSSTILPTIPTRTPPNPVTTPTPTPTRFDGAATKGKVSGGMLGFLTSIIAIAMFL